MSTFVGQKFYRNAYLDVHNTEPFVPDSQTVALVRLLNQEREVAVLGIPSHMDDIHNTIQFVNGSIQKFFLKFGPDWVEMPLEDHGIQETMYYYTVCNVYTDEDIEKNMYRFSPT